MRIHEGEVGVKTAVTRCGDSLSLRKGVSVLSNRKITILGTLLGLFLLCATDSSHAQAVPPLRGVYSPGFTATNSGVMPGPGLTYANTFMDYSFNQVNCPVCGNIPSKINVALFADVNVFLWVSKKKILGANYALATGLPFTNSSLSLAGLGTVGGGGGFADSFYQPLTLGWHLKRADVMAAYTFFAPTGKYAAGATDNTGAGHWTNAPTLGETFYLTKNKATSFSSYQMWEFHTTQEQTNIHPGQTLDVDYSLTQILPLEKNMHTLLQAGLAGYGQWEVTDNGGPGVNPNLPAHYAINGIGGAANVLLPARKATLGVKLIKEVSNSHTVQGYSFQVSTGITF
jgi:hypothetical protein